MHPDKLDTVLTRFFHAMMEDVHTITVGRVESYEGHATRRATVLPLVRPWLAGGSVVQHKPISDVPVVFPGTAGAGVLLPVARGDLVLLLFAEQGIGGFLSSNGQSVDADSPAKFGYQDCIAIPGVFPFKMPPKIDVPKNALVLFNGKSKIIVDKDKITINEHLEILT